MRSASSVASSGFAALCRRRLAAAVSLLTSTDGCRCRSIHMTGGRVLGHLQPRSHAGSRTHRLPAYVPACLSSSLAGVPACFVHACLPARPRASGPKASSQARAPPATAGTQSHPTIISAAGHQGHRRQRERWWTRPDRRCFRPSAPQRPAPQPPAPAPAPVAARAGATRRRCRDFPRRLFGGPPVHAGLHLTGRGGQDAVVVEAARALPSTLHAGSRRI